MNNFNEMCDTDETRLKRDRQRVRKRGGDRKGEIGWK